MLATWHALAKLRLHTESTLKQLEEATKSFGKELHRFIVKMCNNFSTKPLPKESEAHTCRKAKAQSKAAPAVSNEAAKKPADKKQKLFNPNTYKLHAMGDYVEHIRRFGTTDSYSTQRVG